MQYVLGVDGGASKTAVTILNEHGKELGRGLSSSSNYHLVGLENAKQALLAAMQEAANNAGIDLSQISAATWALAGAGRPADKEILETLRAELLPNIPGEVVTDVLAALVGGTGSRYGIVLIAGTGMIAYGENGSGAQARAGGWGHRLDQGSGYALAQEALRAVVMAADNRDLKTSLTQQIQETLELQETAELVNWLYAPGRSVADIAALAPLVMTAAEAGDLVATGIVAQAAETLASSVDAVARQLGLWERPFPLILSGGLLRSYHFFRRIAAQTIHTKSPQARLMLPRADAAVGAALLALETVGYPLRAENDIDDPQTIAWASEQRNVLTEELDLHSTLGIVGLMHLEDRRAVTAVRPNLPAIAEAIDAITARMQQGGRLIYVGAGTSGRLGTLDASECPPTFGISPDLVVGVMAGGRNALVDAVEGAEDDQEMGRQDVADLDVGPLDSVIGIAASGRTPYAVGALEEANRRGALTGAIICNLPAPMADIAEHVMTPLVGPEALAGSTRLKAGTAQKLILNMLSTGVMVRLGKTYGNLMVDVAQHNIKLQNRARRIVAQATGVDEVTASAAFNANNGNVKAAIVSALLNCTPEEAQLRLDKAGGVVRTAVINHHHEN